MNQCHVCGSTEIVEKIVNHVFTIDGQMILVENLPAHVCERCGEETFDVQTVERVRQKLTDSKSLKTIEMPVLSY